MFDSQFDLSRHNAAGIEKAAADELAYHWRNAAMFHEDWIRENNAYLYSLPIAIAGTLATFAVGMHCGAFHQWGPAAGVSCLFNILIAVVWGIYLRGSCARMNQLCAASKEEERKAREVIDAVRMADPDEIEAGDEEDER